MTTPQPTNPQPEEAVDVGHLHDFDAQKELHQKIRNDPDYDDWEYGTEPLPHEAWVAKRASAAFVTPVID